MTIEYKVGDVIEQHCFGCKESARLVRVTHKHTNVKNAKQGFDGVMVDGGYSVWGYDSDVFRVVTPANDSPASQQDKRDVFHAKAEYPARCVVCFNPAENPNADGICTSCLAGVAKLELLP